MQSCTSTYLKNAQILDFTKESFNFLKSDGFVSILLQSTGACHIHEDLFTFYNRVKIDTLDNVLAQVLYVIAFGSLQKSIARTMRDFFYSTVY